jgi:hypothetical protein
MTMQWIMGTTVGAGGAANFDFTNIPSTFTHLQLRIFSRNVGSEVTGEAYITLNGASTNYNNHLLMGDGASATSAGNTYTTLIYASRAIGNSAAANVFGVTIIDILDYANTNKNKVIRVLSGGDNNGSGFAWLGSGLWINTDAVNQVRYRNNFNLGQHSRADLYGIPTSAATGA